MKRGWTRFLASVSLAVLLGEATIGAQRSTVSERSPQHRNELSLAGLTPNRDTLRKAEKAFGQPLVERDGETTFFWDNRLFSNRLHVTTDSGGRIQEVRVELRTPAEIVDGYPRTRNPWRTGKGLAIGAPSSTVERLYGKPDSRSPSTKAGQQLELLYYAFDWAGSEVPQVMEVVCTVGKNGEPGRVVEITLAASSL